MLTQIYLDTDICKVSMEISKMQRLHSRIQTIWNEALIKNDNIVMKRGCKE